MKKSGFLSLLVIAAMTLALFAGCNGSGGGNPADTTASAPVETTAAATSASETEKQTTAEQTTAETKPDFGGYEFTISGYREGVYSDTPQNKKAQDINAIYNNIESEYNCTISFIPETSKDNVITSSIANECIADFLFASQKTWAVAAVAGVLRPLDTNEVKAAGLDISDPDVANQDLIKIGTFLGSSYILPFENSMFVQFAHVVVFNKELCASAGYTADSIFSAVRNFQWDWNMFFEIAAAVSEDRDGDGTYEIQGLCKIRDGSVVSSNGYVMVSYDETTGKYFSAIARPEFQKAAEIWTNLYSNPDVYFEPTDDWLSMVQGTAAFGMFPATDFGSEGLNSRMERDYGILPIPKGPDIEKYSPLLDELFAFFMQQTNANWETSCKIMNLIARELNDPDGAKVLISEFCRDDQDSIDVLYNYVYPYSKMRMDKLYNFCKHDDLRSDIFELGVATACEKWGPLAQAAVDEFFKY